MRYNLGDNVATNPSLLGGLKKIIATINKLYTMQTRQVVLHLNKRENKIKNILK